MKKIRGTIIALLFAVSFFACSNATNSDSKSNDTNSAQNEGTIASPISLSIDAPRVCKVGKLSAYATDSYYVFSTIALGTYYIKATGFSPSSVTGFSPNVYTDSQYSSFPITSVGNYTSKLTCNALNAGTLYYLRLSNMYDSEYDVSYTVTISMNP